MNGFLVAMKFARFAPVWFIRLVAGFGSWIAWLRHAKGVRRLEENLHRVTGLEGRDLRKLSRRGMASAGRYYAEVLELPRMTGEQIDARMRVVGIEESAAAMAANGRICVALGHSGNWDLVGAWTCRNLGTVRTVAEILKPREVFDEFVRLREGVGMTVLGLEGGGTFRQLMSIATRDGGVVALLSDRDLSGTGIEVGMWGRRVRVAPGPAAFALATKTTLAVLYARYERIYGVRRWRAGSRWGSVMEFGGVIEVPEGAKAEQIAHMSQAWATILADRIATYPEDWHMLQRFGWVE
jgi:KDO2-lipid IV(A) lauroyltransferase